MTKDDIIKRVAASSGVEKAVVTTVVESFMECVKDSMAAGNDIFLRGFGSFVIRRRAQKIARDIRRNSSVTIPEHNIPAFKPSPAFKQAVRDTDE